MRMGLGLGLGSQQRVSATTFTADAIAGLAAWIDAYTAPESIDANNGIKTIRCKKTNNQLVAPDIVSDLSTLRPVYDAANKQIVFTAANKQKLSASGFFTTEPFKSATKGMGQAWTLVSVASNSPTYTLTSAAGANRSIRASGDAESGGLFGIPTINTKSVFALIKPAVSGNNTHILDTFNTTSPYALSDNSPVPVMYINTKLTNGAANTAAIRNGEAFTSGNLSIGNFTTLYYNYTVNEFILYDRAIDEADLIKLIAALKKKWGIA